MTHSIATLMSHVKKVFTCNLKRGVVCLVALSPTVVYSISNDSPYQLPTVPAPKANPTTPEKVALGKILFWDEQLSTDNSVACGTCHIPSAAGADNRLKQTSIDKPHARSNVAKHPGYDNALNTSDDLFTSFGVIKRDANGQPTSSSSHRQVTGRTSQNFFGSLWANSHFWDGRARGQFIDPDTLEILISHGASLENQVLGPLMSDVEMAKTGQSAQDVIDKLTHNAPLALASHIPTSLNKLIERYQHYPALFKHAFGDDKITLTRIAFAIAAYERSLVADQTPWDIAMKTSSPLPYLQNLGWAFFKQSGCDDCHTPPTFTDNKFYNVGIQGQNADYGHFTISQHVNDIGAMKVPTLRNVGLKQNFMHTGQFSTLDDVFKAYEEVPYKDIASKRPNGEDYNFQFTAQQRKAMLAFLSISLTDPRVAAETFPFDRPKLRSESNLIQPTQSDSADFVIQNATARFSSEVGITISWQINRLNTEPDQLIENKQTLHAQKHNQVATSNELPSGWDVEIVGPGNKMDWTTNTRSICTVYTTGEVNQFTLYLRNPELERVDTHIIRIEIPSQSLPIWAIFLVVFVATLFIIKLATKITKETRPKF